MLGSALVDMVSSAPFGEGEQIRVDLILVCG
jgi:hypothetical protein